jgi:AcrR family transcriptional regulator
MARELGRDDWLKAARLALLKGGADAVRIETLARKLHVTKGSFYWHFKDRDALLERLLREWEGEMADILAHLGQGSARERLRSFIEVVVERARLSELGDAPSDAAMFAWASVSPKVARRVNRAERTRVALLMQIVARPERVEILYLAWLGFVARGQRVPGLRRQFPKLARTILEQLAEDTWRDG